MLKHITKEEANYRKTTSQEVLTQTNCGHCVHFNPSAYSGQTGLVGTCDIVEGEIQFSKVCDYFERDSRRII